MFDLLLRDKGFITELLLQFLAEEFDNLSIELADSISVACSFFLGIEAVHYKYIFIEALNIIVL